MKKYIFMLFKRLLLFKRKIFKKSHPLNPRKILLIRRDVLGDVALSLEGIYSLVQHAPQAEIWVAANPSYIKLIQKIPGIAGCVPYPSAMNMVQKWRMLRKIRSHQFDLSIDICHGDTLELALMCMLARIPWRIGYDIGCHGFLFHQSCNIATGTLYEKDVPKYILEKTLNVTPLNDVPWAFSKEEDCKLHDMLFEKFGITDQDTVIGFHPSCSDLRPFRAWDIHKYLDLMSKITHAHPYKIIVTGTADDLEKWQKVSHLVPQNVYSLIGETSINELFYLIKRCQGFISNNTGTMHLSVVLKTPTIVINGPSNLVRWGPRDSIHRIVDKNLPCSGSDCLLSDCEKDVECIKSISVNEVYDAFLDLKTSPLKTGLHI